jgi:hypothetical protein
MTAFSNATSALMATLKQAAGAAITYRRGANSVPVTAVRGQSNIEIAQADGRVIQFTSSDWMIEAANLVINGTAVEPARGDTIEHMVGATTSTYEVLDPPFKPMDAGATAYRVYTKRIRTT